jgi:two-component system, NarL family, response regulator YdfI
VERKKTRHPTPGPLLVLPCVGTIVLSDYFTALRAAGEIDLLPVALFSNLASRVRNDQPDAIVIVTEEFATTEWRNSSSLGKALSLTPTLLLVGEVNDSVKRRAARFHIRSTLPLDVTTDQLLASIWAIVAGLGVALELPSQDEDEHIGWMANDETLVDEPFTEHLTARETVVLRLMALGHGNKEIASRLDISEHTAKFHVSSILAKLGAASRTEAVTLGIMRGLVAL